MTFNNPDHLSLICLFTDFLYLDWLFWLDDSLPRLSSNYLTQSRLLNDRIENWLRTNNLTFARSPRADFDKFIKCLLSICDHKFHSRYCLKKKRFCGLSSLFFSPDCRRWNHSSHKLRNIRIRQWHRKEVVHFIGAFKKNSIQELLCIVSRKLDFSQ